MKPERWQKVEKLFYAALEQKPERRADFLAEECAGDEELRSEVESLLKHGDLPDGFIDAPAMKLVARDIASNSDSSNLSLPMVGKTVSHYKIVDKIGEGGMGEVYQAKDLKLGRNVAIKVLPEEFAKDTDHVARFQREATLLASLNHPNIAAIHGLEESGGTQFLVLELVEGETLRDRIKSGPIPVEESLKLALQIAGALEAAHEKGIIHRDLKPANVKVTPDGMVKVLDFGLAKAYAGERADLNLSNPPTVSNAATQHGVILGTAAYMSPEQARGKTVDKRADIWAFGCVLFEMLTGHPTFSGNDVSDILAAVIRSEPEWNDLPANLHMRLREVLERCLEKEAKNRYHDISDVKADIQRILTDPSGVLVQPVEIIEPRNRLRLVLPWVAIAIILGAIIAGVAVWKLKPTPPQEPLNVSRFLIEAAGIGDYNGLTLSPDGSRLVYAAAVDGAQQLFLHELNQTAAVAIQDTKDAMYPFFSPDGNWVGFFTGSELKKVSLSGGLTQMLCKVNYRGGASWGPDDTIVFSSADSPGLMRVSASGGEPQPLTNAENGLEKHVWPEFLPDGKAVLFTIGDASANLQVAVLSLETKNIRPLINGTHARFAPSGHLIFARESSLWAVPFDSEHLDLKGDPKPIVEGVQVNPGGWAHYSLANDGSLAYLAGISVQTSFKKLTWVDRNGKEEPLAAQPNCYFGPRISPDGTKVAMMIQADEKSDIWILDIVREAMTRLTLDEVSDYPLWSLDGQRVVFRSGSFGNDAFYSKAADGTGVYEKLGSGKPATIPCSWAEDGKTLVATKYNPITKTNIGSISMEGDYEWKPLLQEKYEEFQPEISPDGRWMAYTSNQSGKYEIYVRPFPDVNKRRWQISTDGGDSALWSPDGREIFYRNGDEVMAVAVETEPAFKAGKPQTLFSGTYAYFNPIQCHPWDISHDGKYFLMMKELQSSASAGDTQPKINIVLNWFEELKERVPVN